MFLVHFKDQQNFCQKCPMYLLKICHFWAWNGSSNQKVLNCTMLQSGLACRLLVMKKRPNLWSNQIKMQSSCNFYHMKSRSPVWSKLAHVNKIKMYSAKIIIINLNQRDQLFSCWSFLKSVFVGQNVKTYPGSSSSSFFLFLFLPRKM